MKLYCLVEDGIIKYGPKAIPKVYKNISNFNALSDDELAVHGFYETIKESLTENQKHSEPVIDENLKKIMYSAVDKTQEELDVEAQAIINNHIIEIEALAVKKIDSSSHWSAAPMVYDKARGNKPKSKAIKEWTEGIWTKYFTHKAELLAGVPYNEEMINFPDSPYAIAEAMAE
jgi:hypothetical protein